MLDSPNDHPFDQETWDLLPSYFENLPNSVRLHVWGDPEAGQGEAEAKWLAEALAQRFEKIETAIFPRRANYPYYPVIGIFDAKEGEPVDFGLRLIGLPRGYQVTSLIAAIQAVSFRGSGLEAKTRFQLQGLKKDVTLELLTSAEDEGGVMLAKIAFGLAAASPHIRTFLIMADRFPVASVRYSATYLPHMVINGRSHIDGVIEEETLLKKIAAVLR
jgi:alkyl hydroperoxide reductase subunit AhpF